MDRTSKKKYILKIRRIEAINKFGKYYSWSTDILGWDELPKWLLNDIKKEFPYYQLKIEYFKK